MVTKHPLVSVIVPNYNHSAFLDERINSILNQDYDNFELIILDDKSTDNSVEVIKKYQEHSRVSHVILNDKNSGSPFKQWEKGFEKAKGELIWIAESDDFCERGFLGALISEFEKDADCVLAFCRSVKIDVNGVKLSEDGFQDSFSHEGRTFIKKDLSRFNYIVNASSAVFTKSALENMDHSYTGFRGCGDWIFWIEVAKCGHVAYVNQPLNYFRQHGSNTTTEQTRTGKGELEVIVVSNYLKTRNYIDSKDYLRIKVVHIFSVKYGKLSSFFSDDVKREILRGWGNEKLPNFLANVAYYMRCMGIKLINR